MVVEERATQPAEEEVHHTIYSVANLITILRLLLIPFFFAVLVDGDSERSRLVAFVIYAIAGSTDWIDGQIARRTHTVTQFGKVVDPLVDRLLLASGVVGLYLIDVLPLWIPVVLVLRDLYLLYGAYVLEHYRIILPVTFAGKLTTAVLLAGFSSLIAGWPLVPGLRMVDSSWLPGMGAHQAALGIWFVYIGIALSILAAVQYTFVAVAARKAARARAV
ncbi:MAG: CDP-alcohol phosphatidyltransferase family protein [Coriobacteriia bacterium]|nr:CDP-alcohol phosphatidyltransferase family protein [Coriobacteriia bacterium]